MTLAIPGQLGAHITVHAALGNLEVNTGGAGLLLGLNRQNSPVTARVFRPEPTRAMLIGGLACVQLLAYRALALGVRVVVQSARAAAWERFAAEAGGGVGFIAPGSPIPQPATAMFPQLVIIDVGPSVGELDSQAGAWRTTLTVRDELTAWDVDTLMRADVAVMQPLSEVESALAASALGLHEVQEWMSRIRADMVTLASHGTVRWALLAASAAEQQVVGQPVRY
ncbi:MAG: hypothetical protein ACRDTU_11260 [Micromonosporaceae bacterium]